MTTTLAHIPEQDIITPLLTHKPFAGWYKRRRAHSKAKIKTGVP